MAGDIIEALRRVSALCPVAACLVLAPGAKPAIATAILLAALGEIEGERRPACDRREQVDQADLDAPLTTLCSRQRSIFNLFSLRKHLTAMTTMIACFLWFPGISINI